MSLASGETADVPARTGSNAAKQRRCQSFRIKGFSKARNRMAEASRIRGKIRAACRSILVAYEEPASSRIVQRPIAEIKKK